MTTQGVKEVKITVKDDEQSLTKNELVYEDVSLSYSDPVLSGLVSKAEADFKGTPHDIVVKIKMVWR